MLVNYVQEPNVKTEDLPYAIKPNVPVEILGSLSNDNGNGYENVTSK